MKYLIACLSFLSVAAAPAAAQFDYTPGFEPGVPEEMSVLAGLEGDWEIQLFYPAPDAETEPGWRWAEWARSRSSFTTGLGGVVFVEDNRGFPISAASVGAEGYSHWSYRVWWSYDRFQNIYRASIVDNLWGLLDVYEGESPFDISNLETGTFNLLGEGRTAQMNRVFIREMSAEGFVLEWWTLDAAERLAGADRDGQPWKPSVRMVYFRPE